MTSKKHRCVTQTTTMAEIQDARFKELGLSKSISKVGEINVYNRHLDKINPANPLLVLIHGYPQSAYESVLPDCIKNFEADNS
jgi:hypothetical protein